MDRLVARYKLHSSTLGPNELVMNPKQKWISCWQGTYSIMKRKILVSIAQWIHQRKTRPDYWPVNQDSSAQWGLQSGKKSCNSLKGEEVSNFSLVELLSFLQPKWVFHFLHVSECQKPTFWAPQPRKNIQRYHTNDRW